MGRTESEKFFGADISLELYQQYEKWIVKHPKITNRQLQTSMFRMFLSLPEDIQAKMLFNSFDSEPFDQLVRQIVQQELGKNIEQEQKEEEVEKKPVTLRQALHNMVERIKTEETIEGNVIKIEQSDEKTWEELRRIAEPESKPKRKKKGD